MSRRVRWVAASALALAVIVGWLWPRTTPRGATDVSTSSTPLAATASDTATPPPAATGIVFQTRLLPKDGQGARPDTVRIGLGRVAPDQARAYERWIQSDGAGAGPEHYSDLAEIEAWLTPPTSVHADGTLLLGPLPLPAADRFDLRAGGTTALISYAASFTAEAVPATVTPTVAAGLIVSRSDQAEGEARLLLRRVEEAPDAARWQSLMADQAPELLAAFDEAALPLSARNQFAPLPPGPLDLVLQINGVEAERRRVNLIAGQWAEVRFDAVNEAVARAIAVDLELRFVVTGTTEPIEGITATWHAERGDEPRTTDAGGGVTIPNVDRQRPHRFTLQFPGTSGELPLWPETRPLELTLDDDVDETASRPVIRKTIELTPLRWLEVRTGDFPVPFHRQGGQPYPVFVLQQELDGQWIDVAADHFLPIRGGLAVSVQVHGRYRVMALRTPWSVRYSSVAEITPQSDARQVVDLLPSTGHRVEVTVMRDGVPLANAPIALRGPARGLPGLTATSDAAGRLILDEATVPEIWLEVAGYQAERVDLQSHAARVELSIDSEASRRD